MDSLDLCSARDWTALVFPLPPFRRRVWAKGYFESSGLVIPSLNEDGREDRKIDRLIEAAVSPQFHRERKRRPASTRSPTHLAGGLLSSNGELTPCFDPSSTGAMALLRRSVSDPAMEVHLIFQSVL
ncbi:hypothetical protein U1Q18_033438 [Sarracenia purpurea var. burkii]